MGRNRISLSEMRTKFVLLILLQLPLEYLLIGHYSWDDDAVFLGLIATHEAGLIDKLRRLYLELEGQCLGILRTIVSIIRLVLDLQVHILATWNFLGEMRDVLARRRAVHAGCGLLRSSRPRVRSSIRCHTVPIVSL